MKNLFSRKSFELSMILVVLIIGATGYMVFGRNNNKDINENLLISVQQETLTKCL